MRCRQLGPPAATHLEQSPLLTSLKGDTTASPAAAAAAAGGTTSCWAVLRLDDTTEIDVGLPDQVATLQLSSMASKHTTTTACGVHSTQPLTMCAMEQAAAG